MANSRDPNSFDVDKELEQLLSNIHRTENRNNAVPPQRQPQQRQVEQRRSRPVAPSSRQTPQAQQRPAGQQRPAHKPSSAHKTSRLPSFPFGSSKSSAPKTRITSTTKNGLKVFEDKTDYSKIDDSNASYYNGEVYFAAKSLGTPEPAAPAPRQPQRRPHYKPKNKFEAIIYNIGKTIRGGGKNGVMLYVAILFLISAILSIFAMSFVNDILAFTRSDQVQTITVGENATTNQVISQLDKAGLIKHGFFCKVFMGLTSDLHNNGKKPVYLSGVYYLTPSMGLEKMLLQCQETQKADTVTVTIPEGYTIEQIAKKLEKSKVCMSDEFYNNLKKAAFDYSFIKGIDNKSVRYEYLEGYLYPETYEFFVGQNASSVINKLLYTTKDRWNEEYARRAKEMGMTMDEVLTLASIVQKEAGDSEQMAIIAKIFLNRLNSGSFPSLQSDATNVYVNTYIKPNVQAGEYETFWAKYSTYACTGLPVGPICNPGDDAIRAVLWPAETDAFFFCHDSQGDIYTAVTEEQHNANYYRAINGDTED